MGTRGIRHGIVATTLGTAALLAAAAGAGTQGASLVSIGDGGALPDGSSNLGAPTPNGRFVAFSSDATNLLADPTSEEQVFLRDVRKGRTVLVSRTPEGAPGNSSSQYPSLSKNGRYVVFQSLASDLVPGDLNERTDVFVADMRDGGMERVSVGLGGADPDNSSSTYGRDISDDGRLVVFASRATNLVEGDTNGKEDVFLFDRTTGATTLVSHSLAGGAGNNASSLPSISPNGRWVAFESRATDLTDDAAGAVTRVFVYEVRTGLVSLVTRALDGGVPDDQSFDGVVSNNGRWVAYDSRASNLVEGDDNASFDVFVTDRKTGTTRLLTRTPAGDPANQGSYFPSMSANGRVIAFDSSATDLVEDDTNGNDDPYFVDVRRGRIWRPAVAPGGGEGDDYSFSAASGLASNGKWFSFVSDSTNLVEGATLDHTGTYLVRVR